MSPCIGWCAPDLALVRRADGRGEPDFFERVRGLVPTPGRARALLEGVGPPDPTPIRRNLSACSLHGPAPARQARLRDAPRPRASSSSTSPARTSTRRAARSSRGSSPRSVPAESPSSPRTTSADLALADETRVALVSAPRRPRLSSAAARRRSARTSSRSGARAIAVNALFLFAFAVLVLVGYAVGPTRLAPEDRPTVNAVLLWIVIFFSAMTGLSRVFVKEEEAGTAVGPAPRGAAGRDPPREVPRERRCSSSRSRPSSCRSSSS